MCVDVNLLQNSTKDRYKYYLKITKSKPYCFVKMVGLFCVHKQDAFETAAICSTLRSLYAAKLGHNSQRTVRSLYTTTPLSKQTVHRLYAKTYVSNEVSRTLRTST